MNIGIYKFEYKIINIPIINTNQHQNTFYSYFHYIIIYPKYYMDSSIIPKSINDLVGKF
jgi:hypothetical protein